MVRGQKGFPMINENPVSPVLHYIAFEVQNGGTLMFQQTAGVDHDVTLYTHYPDGSDENKITIAPGDMVMLANLYRYIIENDIQDDFVNYGGKNKMRHVTMAEEQPHPIKHGSYLIVWIDKFDCWCIYDERGDKVREPYWSTVYDAERAIESGEAL